MKRIFLLWFLTAAVLTAGNIRVLQDRKLTDLSQGKFFFPKFSPAGEAVFFTSENYNGLWKLSLESGSLEQISSKPGIGYKFQFTADGNKLIYRTTNFKNKRKFHSLFEYDLINKKENVLEESVRNLSPPQINMDGNVFYIAQGMMKTASAKLLKTNNQSVSVFIEDRNLFLSINGERKKLNPLGKGIYLWPSLSPAGDKILFTAGGKGTFICDLNGNILVELGYANYPKWSPDGKWILFMKDKDDGYNYTASDLYVKSEDGKTEVQLTDTANEIEMYGEWSPDGTEIVYHTNNGEIRLIKLQYN